MAFTYANHGDGYQVQWANGRWIIVNDSLSASDVVQYTFEEDAAAGGNALPMAMNLYRQMR